MFSIIEKVAKIAALLIVNIIVCTFIGNLLIDVFLGSRVAYVAGAIIASSAMAKVVMDILEKLDTMPKETEDR